VAPTFSSVAVTRIAAKELSRVYEPAAGKRTSSTQIFAMLQLHERLHSELSP
jgi:hypothetical protein